MSGRRQFRQSRHTEWPHMTTLYNSNNFLDESGNYREHPVTAHNNAFEPPNPNGFFRYYSGQREEFVLDSVPSDGIYSRPPSLKHEEDRLSYYGIGDRFRRGSTCSVILCVIFVLILIAVVIAGVVLSVILSQNILPSASIKYFESEATLNNATFIEALADVNSPEFKQLEKEFCEAIRAMYTSSQSPIQQDYADCEVLGFSPGSIIVRFRIGTKYFSSRNPKEEIPKLLNQLQSHLQYMVTQKGSWDSLRFDETKIQKFKEEDVHSGTTITETTPQLVRPFNSLMNTSFMSDKISVFLSEASTIIEQPETEVLDKSSTRSQVQTNLEHSKFINDTGNENESSEFSSPLLQHSVAVTSKSYVPPFIISSSSYASISTQTTSVYPESIEHGIIYTEIAMLSALSKRFSHVSSSLPILEASTDTQFMKSSITPTTSQNIQFEQQRSTNASKTFIFDQPMSSMKHFETESILSGLNIDSKMTTTIEKNQQAVTTKQITMSVKETTCTFNSTTIIPTITDISSGLFSSIKSSKIIRTLPMTSVSEQKISIDYQSSNALEDFNMSPTDELARSTLFTSPDETVITETLKPVILVSAQPIGLNNKSSQLVGLPGIRSSKFDERFYKHVKTTTLPGIFHTSEPLIEASEMSSDVSSSRAFTKGAFIANSDIATHSSRFITDVNKIVTENQESMSSYTSILSDTTAERSRNERTDISNKRSSIQSSFSSASKKYSSFLPRTTKTDYLTDSNAVKEMFTSENSIINNDVFSTSAVFNPISSGILGTQDGLILVTPISLGVLSVVANNTLTPPTTTNAQLQQFQETSQLHDSSALFTSYDPELTTQYTSARSISTEHSRSVSTLLQNSLPSTATVKMIDTIDIMKGTEVFSESEYPLHAISDHSINLAHIRTSLFSSEVQITKTLGTTSKDFHELSSKSKLMTETSLNVTSLLTTSVPKDVLVTETIDGRQLLPDRSLTNSMSMSSYFEYNKGHKLTKYPVIHNDSTAGVIDPSLEKKFHGQNVSSTALMSDSVYITSSKDTIIRATALANLSMSLQLVNVTSQTKRLKPIQIKPIEHTIIDSFEPSKYMIEHLAATDSIIFEPVDIEDILPRSEGIYNISENIMPSSISIDYIITPNEFELYKSNSDGLSQVLLKTSEPRPLSAVIGTAPITGIINSTRNIFNTSLPNESTLKVKTKDHIGGDAITISNTFLVSKTTPTQSESSLLSTIPEGVLTDKSLTIEPLNKSSPSALHLSTQLKTLQHEKREPQNFNYSSGYKFTTSLDNLASSRDESSTVSKHASALITENGPQDIKFTPSLFPLVMSDEIQITRFTPHSTFSMSELLTATYYPDVFSILKHDQPQTTRFKPDIFPFSIAEEMETNIFTRQVGPVLISDEFEMIRSTRPSHRIGFASIPSMFSSSDDLQTIPVSSNVMFQQEPAISSSRDELQQAHLTSSNKSRQVNPYIIHDRRQENLSTIDFGPQAIFSTIDENYQANFSTIDLGQKPNISGIHQNYHANASKINELSITNVSTNHFGQKTNLSTIDENYRANLSTINLRLKPNVSTIDKNYQANLSTIDSGLKPNVPISNAISEANVSSIDFGEKQNVSTIDENSHANVSIINVIPGATVSITNVIPDANVSTIGFGQEQNVSRVNENYLANLSTMYFGQKENVSTIDANYQAKFSKVDSRQKENISKIDENYQANLSTIDLRQKPNLSTIDENDHANLSIAHVIPEENVSTIGFGQKQNLSTELFNYQTNLSTIDSLQKQNLSTVDENFHANLTMKNYIPEANVSTIDFGRKQNISTIDENYQANVSVMNIISQVNLSAIEYGQKSNVSRIFENYQANSSKIVLGQKPNLSTIDENYNAVFSLTNVINESTIDLEQKQNLSTIDIRGQQIQQSGELSINEENSSSTSLKTSELVGISQIASASNSQILTSHTMTSEFNPQLEGSIPTIEQSNQQTQFKLLETSEYTDTTKEIKSLSTGDIPRSTPILLNTQMESDIELLSIRREVPSSLELPVSQRVSSDIYIDPTKTQSIDISSNENYVPYDKSYESSGVYSINTIFLNNIESTFIERPIPSHGESTLLRASTNTLFDISSSLMSHESLHFENYTHSLYSKYDASSDMKNSTLFNSSIDESYSTVENIGPNVVSIIEDTKRIIRQSMSTNINITEFTRMLRTTKELPVSTQIKNEHVNNTRNVLSTSVYDNEVSTTNLIDNTTENVSTSLIASFPLQPKDNMYISLHNVTLSAGIEQRTTFA